MGEPVQTPIMYGGRFAGLNREYSRNILSARWRLDAARLGSVYGSACGSAGLGLRLGVNGAAWLKYGARARQSSSTSSARGLRVVVCAESSGGACGIPPSPMKLILAAVSSSGCALHCGMIKTCF